MKFVKKKSNTTFFKEVFEEESRNNENDSPVNIAALAVSAIALTGVAPIIDSRFGVGRGLVWDTGLKGSLVLGPYTHGYTHTHSREILTIVSHKVLLMSKIR